MTMEPQGTDGQKSGGRRTAASVKPKDPKADLIRTAFMEVGVPLGLYYGLREVGLGQWLSLLVSGAVPLAQLVYRMLTEGRVATVTLFTLSVMASGTAITLLTGDVRLLLARESYLTGLLGLWMIGTLLAKRPFMFTTMIKMLPEETARTWHANWDNHARFRNVMRWMSVAWGAAFLIDSAARIVMAYTLPVDLVPVLSVILLIGMLMTVVKISKSYGRRMMAELT
ncbi:VC0807 family protein [Kitasatospora aureofaciens]|uniref:VC0807 family protein n=1 Tax=Kitasatospora aureofaciens TaxID=1894 RepID=UPI00068C429A|nr:VC0807 family protein [Kitasatospora aureofaciens]